MCLTLRTLVARSISLFWVKIVSFQLYSETYILKPKSGHVSLVHKSDENEFPQKE